MTRHVTARDQITGRDLLIMQEEVLVCIHDENRSNDRKKIWSWWGRLLLLVNR